MHLHANSVAGTIVPFASVSRVKYSNHRRDNACVLDSSRARYRPACATLCLNATRGSRSRRNGIVSPEETTDGTLKRGSLTLCTWRSFYGWMKVSSNVETICIARIWHVCSLELKSTFRLDSPMLSYIK